MKTKKTILISLIFFVFYSGFAQRKVVSHYFDNFGRYETSSIKITHIKVNVGFIPEKGEVNATANMDFENLRRQTDSIIFHAPDIKIKDITISGKQAKYKFYGNKLTVYPPEKLSFRGKYNIAFDYTATPSCIFILLVGRKMKKTTL